MKAVSKTLVLAAIAAFATTASAGDLVKHEKGITYDDVCTCLTGLGMEENRDFRKGADGIIQFNMAAVQSDFLNQGVTKQEIDSCWKKRKVDEKGPKCPSSPTDRKRN